MFLIFNAQGQFIASSDNEPDSADLSSRNEQAVETELEFTNPILQDGQIIESETAHQTTSWHERGQFNADEH